MPLPIPKLYEPMNAKLVADVPSGPEWQFEPKWDGFRCIAFRDGEKIDLRSKSGQPLARYFPEVVESAKKIDAKRFVLDGEIVVPLNEALSFDALLQRIHPAASRVKKLSQETPAIFIVFDLLVDADGKKLVDLPLHDRREALQAFVRSRARGSGGIVLSPATPKRVAAMKWYAGVGAALDGVIAKRVDLPYRSGNRHGMVKIKRIRTADCVVGGFRYASSSKAIGSLLLGLYNEKKLLDHVGFCSSFTASERVKLKKIVEPLIGKPGFTGNAPGRPSRWSSERSTQWQPLKTKLVVEVHYDHFTNGRFRHGTKFMRWRPDKSPGACTMKQVKQEAGVSPMKLLGKA